MSLSTHSLTRWCRPRLILAALLLCFSAVMAQAQTSPVDDASDPPQRVARLAYINGDLSLLPAGASNWSDAPLNRPLTNGDRLSSGDSTMAALDLGGASLRIAWKTELGLLTLNDQLAQVELTQGTANLDVRHVDAGQSYEIDTPAAALVINQPSTLRVDLSDAGTLVTVLTGQAVAYGDNDARRDLYAGRRYLLNNSSLATVVISEIRGSDNFDAWCNTRDRRYAQSDSDAYVSTEMVGYEDLDHYGSWQNSDDDGAVWFPREVAADWAPYRDGHWAYIAPWGWTWVDNAPWGFAPYHYGRWAYLRGSWGWIPGPRDVRPIYAPALVAFVGGNGWTVGISRRPVGWFPLGPGDIYNPWYHSSRNYYTHINLHNMRHRRGYDRDRLRNDVDRDYPRYRSGLPVRGEHYANRNAPRSVTAMPGQAFASGRPVSGHQLRVDSHALANTTVLPGGTTIRPMASTAAVTRSPHTRTRSAERVQQGRVMARHGAPNLFLKQREMTASPRAAGDTPISPVRASRETDSAAITDVPRARRTPTPAQSRGTFSTVTPAPQTDRVDELPSSRFVRSRNHDNLAPSPRRYTASPTARPSDTGVSYVANPEQNREQSRRNRVT
ncbi:MAG: DUF6600 domain-containing protein, partial [Rhodanobacter sp.]